MDRASFNRSYLKDTSFAQLMQNRIYNVLLIASRYDIFMLEDDGRVDEQIFFEYVSLNLRYPPRFTQVTTHEEAFEELASRRFDLIISMPGSEKSDAFEQAKLIKKRYPDIPIVVLTPFSREVSQRLAKEDTSGVDYIFSWLGNSDLLLAIIKLIEDKMNLEADVASVGVQVLLFVEDSIRFYSSILPHLYQFVLKQSQIFSTEALNAHEQMLRMRGRPKIVLARNYEEAENLYARYKSNILGIVSDVSFMHAGVKDPQAGITFLSNVRREDPFLPLIMESSELKNQAHAVALNASFLDKNSKKLPVDLRATILRNFGFGDFEFIDPVTGEVLERVQNLQELYHALQTVPDASFAYHATRNHISRWLYSRALYPIAVIVRRQKLKEHTPEEYAQARLEIIDAIVRYRKMKNRGVVAEFRRERFDRYSNFARIGEGSLGGKGRGLAFLDSVIKRHPELDDFEGASVAIPKTIVLCTDIFDEFMESNNLYQMALSDIPDEQILHYFLRAKLPDRLIGDFFAFFDVVKCPIAIRSSSLLEDSYYQPFAGIYSTYMIPYVGDRYEMLRMLSDSIKGVYASVFYADSKAYMTATSNIIDQEKMAIILQEVVGEAHERCYYPTFSGVARSLNYYPINDEKPEDGVASVAVGLGKYIVDGGQSLRFSPRHPAQVLQTSTLDLALSDTQTRFYALDLNGIDQPFSVHDDFNLIRCKIQDATVEDKAMQRLVSTYDHLDQLLRPGYYKGADRKVITFANILQNETFPLAKLVEKLLRYGAQEMGREVEIEFAVNLKASNPSQGTLYWLQIRPIVDMNEEADDSIDQIPENALLLKSSSALGNGTIQQVQSIVYVKPESFSSSNNVLIAREIEKINRNFVEKGEFYVLIGPGRWGSSDTALGIPVKWPHISNARVIVENTVQDYWVDPSQGTHFFQNLTSFGVGYFTIDALHGSGSLDLDYLNTLPATQEGRFVRIVSFEEPLTIKINGKKNIGIILHPAHDQK